MVKYIQSKIFKIQSPDGELCFIGTTTLKYLSQRKAKLVSDYREHIDKRVGKKRPYYEIFEKFDPSDVNFILIEEYTCRTVDQLKSRTQKYINETDCLNKKYLRRN